MSRWPLPDVSGPEVHPIVDGMNENPKITKVLKPAGESASFGTGWHTDNSFFEEPSMGSVLYGKTIPPFGGDTLFANQYLAYEALSDTMKEMLDGLDAVHSASEAYTVEGTQAKYDKKTAITYSWDESIMDEVVHPLSAHIPKPDARRFTSMTCSPCAFRDVQVGKPCTTRLSFHSCHPPRILLPFSLERKRRCNMG